MNRRKIRLTEDFVRDAYKHPFKCIPAGTTGVACVIDGEASYITLDGFEKEKQEEKEWLAGIKQRTGGLPSWESPWDVSAREVEFEFID